MLKTCPQYIFELSTGGLLDGFVANVNLHVTDQQGLKVEYK